MVKKLKIFDNAIKKRFFTKKQDVFKRMNIENHSKNTDLHGRHKHQRKTLTHPNLDVLHAGKQYKRRKFCTNHQIECDFVI